MLVHNARTLKASRRDARNSLDLKFYMKTMRIATHEVFRPLLVIVFKSLLCSSHDLHEIGEHRFSSKEKLNKKVNLAVFL